MIFYALVGLAAMALLYTHTTAVEYTTIPDDPSIAPYTVEILPMGTLLASMTLIHVANCQGGSRYMPRPFMATLVGLSCIACVVFGILWWLVGQYPAAISAVCVLGVTVWLVPRMVTNIPKLA